MIPFVGLDFHTKRQAFPLAMSLEIGSDVTERAVLHCLRSRACSARVFGVPLNQSLLRTAMPALTMAEGGRRTAASLVRYAKKLAS
jgi:hypothetical protein